MRALSDPERRELQALLDEADRRGLLRPDLGEWLRRARPEMRWDYSHMLYMQDVLNRVTAGELMRVIFTVAIRHGKTELNTISYGAYRLQRDPRTRILLGSYNERRAHKFSREIRRLVRARGVPLSGERVAAGEWETAELGGVVAVGAGAGTASINADLILIDDPIGNRADAESEAHRDMLWDWITNDILGRTEPHTAVLVTASRWHDDDVIGRLRERHGDRWYVVDLPGRAEDGDVLGRANGDPLWPELRGREWLDEKRVELLEYGFASLVQGRPRPREGGMFKWDWWRLMATVPEADPMVRYWDLAGTDVRSRGHDPDYTVGALLCRMWDDRTAVVHVERFRRSVAARDARLVEVCSQDLIMYPGRVRWWIETEAGIQGKERTDALVRRLQALGMAVYTEHPTGKKEFRAEPLASKAEAGNVVLCPGGWRDTFRLEAADFPNGKHDDQIDAAAGADAKLGVPVSAVSFESISI